MATLKDALGSTTVATWPDDMDDFEALPFTTPDPQFVPAQPEPPICPFNEWTCRKEGCALWIGRDEGEWCVFVDIAIDLSRLADR